MHQTIEATILKLFPVLAFGGQGATTKNVTTFVTKDSAEHVLAFYKAVLKKNPQWKLDVNEPDFLQFATEYGIYELNVLLTVSPSGTSVRLVLNHLSIP